MIIEKIYSRLPCGAVVKDEKYNSEFTWQVPNLVSTETLYHRLRYAHQFQEAFLRFPFSNSIRELLTSHSDNLTLRAMHLIAK